MQLKISIRALLCAAGLMAVGTVSAEVVAFELCGHVKTSTPMAPAGTPVMGRFSWDTSAPVTSPGGVTWLSSYGPPYTGPFTFTVGPHSVSAENTGVTVFNDTGSNVADMIDFGGNYPIVIDGTVFDQGYFSIRLASSPAKTSVFQDTSLPAHLEVARFDSQSMNYFQMYSGVVQNEVMLDATVDWIRRSGEPRSGQSERRECLPASGN
jgi:hypothetical protein